MQIISRFNKLIRSKILWGIFLVVISITFVGYFSPRSGCDAPQKTGEGRLFNRDITPTEFQRARFFALGLRELPASSRLSAKDIRRRTWQRLAMLAFAPRMGIAVSDQEMAQTIQMNRAFTANGVFQKDRYVAAVREQFRVDVPFFESYLREELAMAKFDHLLRAGVWTAPSSLSRQIRNYTDEFSLQCVTIPQTILGTPTNIAPEAAQEYFERRKEAFTIPRRINVRYVEFPVSNYLGRTAIRDSAIQEYYENHEEDFAIRGTNDEAIVRPIDEVRTNIVEVLTRMLAVEEAKKVATDFVMSLAPDRYENALPMPEAAAKMSLTIHTSQFFAVSETIPDLDVDKSASRIAFNLEPEDPQDYFSDAIVASQSVYVIATCTNIPERIPDFQEVADKVTPLAQSNLNYQVFVRKANEIRESVDESLQNGKTFAEAIGQYDFNIQTTRPFTVYEEHLNLWSGDTSNQIDNITILSPAIMRCEKGDITDVLEVEEGALLAYVADRQPGSPTLAEQLRPEFIQEMEKPVVSQMYESWGDYLLTLAHFQDNHPITASGQDEEESDDGMEDQ